MRWVDTTDDLLHILISQFLGEIPSRHAKSQEKRQREVCLSNVNASVAKREGGRERRGSTSARLELLMRQNRPRLSGAFLKFRKLRSGTKSNANGKITQGDTAYT